MSAPVVVLTGGHPYAAEPFFAVFDALCPGRWEHRAQPDAATTLNPRDCAGTEAVVFYDMPGIAFTRADPPAAFPEPPAAAREGLLALLEAGVGMVFLHHAVAGWPAWPLYAEIVGGRFHYQPAELDGRRWPDSGYRFDVTHEVEVVDASHPVCAGLGAGFTLTDELYCFPVLEDRVEPLLRTRFPTGDASQFFSADLAIRGRRNSNDGWEHPAGSDLVGWAKHAGNSPVVYLQFGDGPATYADAGFRRVLANAMAWVATPAAREWARARRASTGRFS
jgi:type 1 glutamine amidotransferase